MNNFLRYRLNVEHPIIQAPMVGVSTPSLAAAVSNAGALGSIGVGASTAEQARSAIQATRQLTDKPFNVNLFCHQPATARPDIEAQWLEYLASRFLEFDAVPPNQLREIYPSFLQSTDMLEMLVDEKPAVVSFHFGLPQREWVAALQREGITILSCVTSVYELMQAQAVGVDAIVAQGVEAGGHRGVFEPERDDELGTLALLPQIIRKTDLPVIAAGGIMDGRGIHAMMALGASGVQMGTAFILCPESSANDQYRTNLKSEKAYNTRITSNISGRPARGLANRFYHELDVGAPPRPDYPIAYDAGKALTAAASAKGCFDFAVQWAGQGAPMARELPAEELVALLVSEWQACC
ncbi:nitronate monooxygenase [Aestuariicella sp. G3-2]|uniref:NAD(P)H-dependent flavin oxidoreductase n=1 Tax=Pseudomaricurvus albidus TaxID=2842452 RepID=UPI001C0CDBB8|nr:nitronate monooxygenase [Aestuariicella albida]MBU3069037.1 nitronate monooxygenase [Aestuariicella albida]